MLLGSLFRLGFSSRLLRKAKFVFALEASGTGVEAASTVFRIGGEVTAYAVATFAACGTLDATSPTVVAIGLWADAAVVADQQTASTNRGADAVDAGRCHDAFVAAAATMVAVESGVDTLPVAVGEPALTAQVANPSIAALACDAGIVAGSTVVCAGVEVHACTAAIG